MGLMNCPHLLSFCSKPWQKVLQSQFPEIYQNVDGCRVIQLHILITCIILSAFKLFAYLWCCKLDTLLAPKINAVTFRNSHLFFGGYNMLLWHVRSLSFWHCWLDRWVPILNYTVILRCLMLVEAAYILMLQQPCVGLSSDQHLLNIFGCWKYCNFYCVLVAHQLCWQWKTEIHNNWMISAHLNEKAWDGLIRTLLAGYLLAGH